tara:strand:- start:59 stop:277 length:219 start_codon:yes stop_codon:yes gene_type:complete
MDYQPTSSKAIQSVKLRFPSLGVNKMVSVLPTSGSANGVVSWLWYGMLATAAFAITQGVIGAELTEAIRKKA